MDDFVFELVGEEGEVSVAEEVVLTGLGLGDSVDLHVGIEDCQGKISFCVHFISSFNFYKLCT